MRALAFLLRLHALPPLARHSGSLRKPRLSLEVRYIIRPSGNDKQNGLACGYLAPLYHQDISLFSNEPKEESRAATSFHIPLWRPLLSIVLVSFVLKGAWSLFQLDETTQLKIFLIMAILSVWGLLALVLHEGIKIIFED